MQKILFQTVGTGGENYPVWEALALCVKEYKPDLLVQWCSELTEKQTIPKFMEMFPQGLRCKLRIEICEDADDLEELMLQYARQIDEAREQYPESQLAVDYTSGTKAMSAAAVAAAIARQVPTLFYGVGDRDDTGRASRTERHINTPTDQLIAGPLLDELGKLFNLGQFPAVKEQSKFLFDNLMQVENADPQLKARAKTLHFLSDVYNDWDRFRWGKAFATIRDRSNELDQMLESVQWDTQLITSQYVHLKKCKQNNFKSPHRIADLLANIQRRIDTGFFDDAVSRLYRAVEYIVQTRIAILLKREKEDNPTNSIPRKTLKQYAPETTAGLREKPHKPGKINLGMRDAVSVLNEANDAIGVKLAFQMGNSGRLKDLLDRRNTSWLAHGSVPVEKKDAEELQEIVLGISHQHAKVLDFDLVQQLKIATFQKCPWS